jgi:hypothetical protein
MITIILAILVVFLFYLGNKWITKNAYHDPIEDTFYIHERLNGDSERTPDLDCGIYEDEHSPIQLDFDKSLKITTLQNELRKSENETKL